MYRILVIVVTIITIIAIITRRIFLLLLFWLRNVDGA